MMNKNILFIILMLNFQGLIAQDSSDILSMLNMEKEFQLSFKNKSTMRKGAFATTSRLDSVRVFKNQYLDHNELDMTAVHYYSYANRGELEGIEIIHFGPATGYSKAIIMKETFSFDNLDRLSNHILRSTDKEHEILPRKLCFTSPGLGIYMCFDSISRSYIYDENLKREISDGCWLVPEGINRYVYNCVHQASKEYSDDEQARLTRIRYEGYQRSAVLSENFIYSPEGRLSYYYVFAEPPKEHILPGELKKYTSSGSGDTIISHIRRSDYDPSISPDAEQRWLSASKYHSFSRPDETLEILIKRDSSASTNRGFLKNSRFEYLHNDQGQLINKKIYRHEGVGGDWKLMLEQVLDYNSSGDTLSEAICVWDDKYQSWKDFSRREFHYSDLTTIGPSRAQRDFRVYPNPASTVLFMDPPEGIFNYSILSSQGQLLKKGPLIDSRICLEGLNPGIYFLILQSNEGKIMASFLKN